MGINEKVGMSPFNSFTGWAFHVDFFTSPDGQILNICYTDIRDSKHIPTEIYHKPHRLNTEPRREASDSNVMTDSVKGNKDVKETGLKIQDGRWSPYLKSKYSHILVTV